MVIIRGCLRYKWIYANVSVVGGGPASDLDAFAEVKLEPTRSPVPFKSPSVQSTTPITMFRDEKRDSEFFRFVVKEWLGWSLRKWAYLLAISLAARAFCHCSGCRASFENEFPFVPNNLLSSKRTREVLGKYRVVRR